MSPDHKRHATVSFEKTQQEFCRIGDYVKFDDTNFSFDNNKLSLYLEILRQGFANPRLFEPPYEQRVEDVVHGK